jgi:RNA polymerase sigma-70 factor (ECF subfamily)
MIQPEAQKPDDGLKELISPVNDEEIIKRVAEGEKNLYALIIRNYNQRLYRIAMSIINNESEVHDVMQTTYIKAYENLGKFKFQSNFSTWLTKILINESLMYLKRKKQGDLSKDGSPGIVEIQTPLMKVLNSELKTTLELSIRKLPEKYRTVFIMREMESMTVAETMDCLGLSAANVKVRLNRAKVMLRNELKDYLKGDDVFQLYKPHCDRIVSHVMGTIIKETI